MSEQGASFDQRSFIAELDDVAAVLKSTSPGHAGHEGWTLRSSGVLSCSCGEPLYAPDAQALPSEPEPPVAAPPPRRDDTAGAAAASTAGAVSAAGTAVVVPAPQEIDIATADAFSRALSEALATHPAEVEIDLSRTTFCDSTALRLLVNATRQARSSGCRLVLSSPPRQLLLMADVLGVSGLLGLDAR